MIRSLLVCVLLLAAMPLLAQDAPEDEEPSPEPVLVTTKCDMNLHTSPGGPAKGVVKKGIEVTVVGTSNGWMRVRDGSRVGWVDRRNLIPRDRSVRMEVSFTRKAQKAPPCADNLEHCGPVGCETGDDPASKEHALMNVVKRGPGSGRPTRLTIASFAKLQARADTLVGQGASLSAADRESLRKLKIGSVSVGEGHLVTVTGYLIGDPHPNDHETVNCNLTGKDNNDFHIPLADSPGKTPFEGIVVEAIPQGRNPGWTDTKMKKIVKAKQRVMITGQLFYDSAHRVRTNDNPSLRNQPQRFSLWEVHPVNEFLVCTTPPCSPTKKSQWTKLEDVP